MYRHLALDWIQGGWESLGVIVPNPLHMSVDTSQSIITAPGWKTEPRLSPVSVLEVFFQDTI